MTALELTTRWPVPNVAAAIIDRGVVAATMGDIDRVFRLASVTKPLTAWATLVAVEEGVITLDSPVGQPGCTLRHLLAHAGGYGFNDHAALSKPARTRGYSNAGFEILAAAVGEAAEMSFADYLRDAVFEPLDMTSSGLFGSPAHQGRSTVADMIRFVTEVRTPRVVNAATGADAARVHYPSLGGIVPGVGRYERCPWGLGFEVRGEKSPHWTGAANSAATYGHFGGDGTMFWIDPVADVAVIALTDRRFGEWALTAWPELSDRVLAECAR